jgi:hypothetical protein
MGRALLISVFTLIFGCADTSFRFERIDGTDPVTLPLNFEGFAGRRDGANVTAEARFAGGGDSVTMTINLYLRPPAEFRSGTYQGMLGGKMISGNVECPSLAFQGGQTALPTVGGVFVLKDEANRPRYRVRIPATTLSGTRGRSGLFAPKRPQNHKTPVSMPSPTAEQLIFQASRSYVFIFSTSVLNL